MTELFPWTIEAEATVSARLLIFAGSFDEASEIFEERMQELHDHIKERAALPDSEYILYDADFRPAAGFECLGANALVPGAITLDECGHEDHEHGEGE